jgi:hypothetical protein
MLNKRTLKILIISLIIVIASTLWLLYVSGANSDIDSPFTHTPPNIDGVISDNEWDNTPSIELEHGFLMVQNDVSNLYILIDLTGDTVDDSLIPLIPDEPWGDFFDVSFDVNSNSEIDNSDIIYGIHPDTLELGLSIYQEPGVYGGIQSTSSLLAKGFGASFNSMTTHRIWELSIDLDEIDAIPDSLIRLGVKTYSLNPRFYDLLPENIDQDFTNLVEIKLANTESNDPNPEDITTTIKPSMDSAIHITLASHAQGSEVFIHLGNHHSRGLIQFDLSSIPQGSKVSSATLRLYYGSNSDNPAGRTYIVNKLTQLWTEEGVTWEKYDGTNEWTEPGGDYTSSGANPARVPSNTGTWITWDVTHIARDWIEEGQENYGLLIKDANEDVIVSPPFYISYFHSREHPQTEFHPELIISYTNEPDYDNYTLTITTSGSGYTNPSAGVYSYSDSRELYVSATPDLGWELSHWVLNGINMGYSDGWVVTMEEDLNIEAVFTATHASLSTIKIYVKDTSGNPINRAEVTSITQPSGQTTLGGTTNPEGYVAFEQVKSGSYTFLASSEEYESNSESITVSQEEINEKTILMEKKSWEIPGFPFESLLVGLTFIILVHAARAQNHTYPTKLKFHPK